MAMDEELFEGIMDGFKEATAYVKGEEVSGIAVHHFHAPEAVDVAAIRKRLKLTQQSFAETFGFSLSNVKQWECGARNPTKSARVLLTVIDKQPGAVMAALSSTHQV